MDAGNMLKPALARGELHVVGATTLDEYRRNIEKDAALDRRFQPVLVPEPSVEDTVAILRGLRDRYEAHHQVRFTDEALVAAAELSDRYITDRFLPDKAIDLIDQAGARVRLRTRDPGRRRARAGAASCERAAAGTRTRRSPTSSTSGPPRCATSCAELQARARRPRGGGGEPPAVPEVGAGRDRRGGVPGHRHPGQPAHRGGDGTGCCAWRSTCTSGWSARTTRSSAVAEAVRRSRAGLGDPDRPIGQLPVPRPDRRRQDRAGPGAGRGALRRRRTG